jgi:chemotaxis signal transduction protein
MSAVELHISERAAELRNEFDRSFVEARYFQAVETEDFLAIHAGGDPYALRLREIAGLFADRKITELPSAVIELKGIAAFRSAMVPVYDLAALLRYPPSTATRWMVLAAEARVALAFDSFDGHVRLARTGVASHEGAAAREHLHQIGRTGDGARPIIHLPFVIAAIRKRIPAAAHKEH